MLYPAPGAGSSAADAATAKGLVGKRLPIVGKVDIAIIEEPQPRLLSFDTGALDYFSVPPTLAENILAGDKLKPDVRETWHGPAPRNPAVDLVLLFQSRGSAGRRLHAEKLALRRAISMGYDRGARITKVLNGQAIPATQLVPPGLYGHDPKYVARYGTTPRPRARCSTGSATRIATATATASCPMASR